MKFVASYSGGKESALAIYEAQKLGHTAMGLITTYNVDAGRSHFHGLSEGLLEGVAQSIGVPLHLVKTTGQEYAKNFELALHHAKATGAEACVFGDIDIEGHIKWCTERCEAAGLEPLFPLLGRPRRDVVFQLIDSGFVATVSVINKAFLGYDVLGKQLTKALAEEVEANGADICGENGEYHTFVSDGPIFAKPVPFTLGEKITRDGYAMVNLLEV